jgi:hypothetical protein
VIVESRLPELAIVSPAISVSGELFEGVNEFYEVAGICSAFCNELKMVGH